MVLQNLQDLFDKERLLSFQWAPGVESVQHSPSLSFRQAPLDLLYFLGARNKFRIIWTSRLTCERFVITNSESCQIFTIL